jgi:serine phosphatase RsbU (regulator of sigma subunit)
MSAWDAETRGIVTNLDLGKVLLAAGDADPSGAPDLLRSASEDLSGSEVVVYLADFGRDTLEPLPDRGSHAAVPETEAVVSSIAGRAFSEQRIVTAERIDGTRVWAPIIEGSECTGVLALTVPTVSDPVLDACKELGLLAGLLISNVARSTDFYNLYRRRQALSLAATMQWDLLPPLVMKSPDVAVAGVVEPAYEVGGDCFDYAVNSGVFNVAVFDALGHGVKSALLAALAVGSYRHDRREGRRLERVHANLDAALARHVEELAFVTGLLAQLDLHTGLLTWTNAGHPLPLLIRDGSVVRVLACPPTPPWGLGERLGGAGRETAIATEALEPGDSVLFYTDGVTEAHHPGGEMFGIDRLSDLVGRHLTEGLAPEEIVRRITRAVLAHHADRLADDATLVLARWNGPSRGTGQAAA